MEILKKVKFGNDKEFSICDFPIFHSYTNFTDGVFTKDYCIFPNKCLKEKLYDTLVNNLGSTCDYIFVPSPGLGDVYFFASYISQFKKNNPGTIGVLLRENRCVNLLKHFPDIDEVYVSHDYFIRCFNSDSSTPKIKKHAVTKIQFPYNSDIYAPKCFGMHYAYLLGLKKNTVIQVKELDNKYIDLAKNEYSKNFLDYSKTIIIAPYSRYFNSQICPVEFWKQIADRLISNGYNVVFNTMDKNYSDYKCIFPQEIMVLIGMIKLCKTFISMRAGINDVLGGFGVKHQIIFYPTNFSLTQEACFDKFRLLQDKLTKNKFGIEKEKFLLDFYSIKSNFNINCKEIVLPENKYELINEIVNNIIKEG